MKTRDVETGRYREKETGEWGDTETLRQGEMETREGATERHANQDIRGSVGGVPEYQDVRL
jgi:hypothetical protein